VVELIQRSVPMHERIALMSVADCALVTATRDGMNLMPYEYITCRQGPADVDQVIHITAVSHVEFHFIPSSAAMWTPLP
jgi:hypothetical protein